ncbi:hypothetical protein MHYP_G00250320 [Metynnis hypsauchen]
MERSRAVLITLVYVLFSRISGAEVEMRVRPGDDITLYSDCFWEPGEPVWFRNSSNEIQSPLIISGDTLIQAIFSCYSFVWNACNQAHDLLVKNVTESDLGLYYCAVQEIKFIKDETGADVRADVYHHGNRTTRLSFFVMKADKQEWEEKKQSQTSRRNNEVGGDDVCYASLDLPSRGQKRLKKKRDESSDFSTYSEVKMAQMISGAEVEKRVRPGDDVILYSDCVWKSGFNTVWFRNCAHDHQPPLIISAEDLMHDAFPRYTTVWNSSSQAHDLLVKNVSESDLGLYYCALREKKITEGRRGGGVQKDIYHYGNRATLLALLGRTDHL